MLIASGMLARSQGTLMKFLKIVRGEKKSHLQSIWFFRIDAFVTGVGQHADFPGILFILMWIFLCKTGISPYRYFFFYKYLSISSLLDLSQTKGIWGIFAKHQSLQLCCETVVEFLVFLRCVSSDVFIYNTYSADGVLESSHAFS